MNALTESLTDDEFERLGDFLYGLHRTAMTLEELDGFFCALICGPDLVPPSEYLPHIFGGELVQGHGFSNIEEVTYIMTRLNRHWNTIAGTLLRGEVYEPMIFDNEDGIAKGNEWAIGFEHGIDLRRESWRKLVDDDEDWAKLAPVILLAHEHHSNPEMRSDVFITPDKREEILCQLAGCTLLIYDLFREWTQGKATRKKPSRKKRRDVQ
jgi:uncharacterized protein